MQMQKNDLHVIDKYSANNFIRNIKENSRCPKMYQLVIRDWHGAIKAPPCFFVVEADLYGQTGDLTVCVYDTVLDSVKTMHNG